MKLTCKQCKQSFTRKQSKGRLPQFCSDQCRNKYRSSAPAAKKASKKYYDRHRDESAERSRKWYAKRKDEK